MTDRSSSSLPTDSLGLHVKSPGQRDVYVAAEAIRFQFSRSSGPGGQNVNKVNTRAELLVSLADIHGLAPEGVVRLRSLVGKRISNEGEIRIVCQATRSQESNREEALAILHELLKQAMTAPKPRRKTRPSRGSVHRRIEGKKHTSKTKAGRKGDFEE